MASMGNSCVTQVAWDPPEMDPLYEWRSPVVTATCVRGLWGGVLDYLGEVDGG
jgi:hypothetical protein